MRQHTERHNFTRVEAVAFLREVADLVEAGRMERGGILAKVPEKVRIKLELETDEIEVRVRWP